MRSTIQFLILVAVGCCPVRCGLLCVDSKASAQEASSAQLQFFEQSIRPLLAEHCYECHSGRAEKLKGGLRLDSRQHLLTGGDSGPVVVPGDPAQSVLIESVRYEGLEMPPSGRLSDRDVELLTRWVKIGAPYPESTNDADGAKTNQKEHSTTLQQQRRDLQVTDADRQYWAYRPVVRPIVPTVRESQVVLSEIDCFVQHRLDQVGLTPNGQASKRELIRRAYFDLVGLPPSPAQVAAFIADDSPTAWSHLIDDLLARPQYGERWARRWLDTVRYAQSNGYERDDEKPLAWRYRDYVIDAMNADKPFDQFVIEQLAGDELPVPTDESITATGFYRLGVWDDEPDDKQAAEFEGLDDIVSTVGQVFLGQTIGCARCHNHMFDPIPQEDYYRMLALVRNVKYYIAAGDDKADETIFTQLPSGKGKSLSVREHGREAPATHLLVRGDARTPAHEVQPGVPRVLCQADPDATLTVAVAPEQSQTTGRRTALANWIASAQNPLTARVIVNRIWLHHFGQGIVATPDDFGRAGMPPTHPELLDWLAAEFIEQGWSLKQLHRTIMQSRTYQRSSRVTNDLATKGDPGNQLLWRQNLRRLDAEAIRDAALAVSGNLNLQMGGRGVFPQISGEVVAGQSRPGLGWDVSTTDQRRRRSIYIFVKRGLRDPMMEAFDYVNTTAPLGARPTTTVAPQALLLLNSGFTSEQAQTLAQRLHTEAGPDQDAQITRLYQLVLQRQPTQLEQQTARDYLERTQRALLRLTSQLLFRPNVPPSLSGEYRRKLRPEDFLLGPCFDWSYFPGAWGGGYEGIDVVDKQWAPFALWNGRNGENAATNLPGEYVVRGHLKLHNPLELATLLLHGAVTEDRWRGIGIELDARGQMLRVVYRPTDSDERQLLGEAAVPLPFEQPVDIRIEVSPAKVAAGNAHSSDSSGPTSDATNCLSGKSMGTRLSVWCGASGKLDKPVVQCAMPANLRGGRLGFSVWGAAVTIDELMIAGGDLIWEPAREGLAHEAAEFSPGKDAATNRSEGSAELPKIVSRQRALAALCQLMLNLNEFVYVD